MYALSILLIVHVCMSRPCLDQKGDCMIKDSPKFYTKGGLESMKVQSSTDP